MTGAFVHARDVKRDTLDWGELGWTCGPGTGARQLTVLDVTLQPGFGHEFHKHPGQEEVIVVQSGWIEQWLERDHSTLGPGDAVFIPAGTVHASFTVGEEAAHLTVALSPWAGESGYEVEDVAAEEPWRSLREGA